MKKTISIILSMLMVLSLSVSAFASQIVPMAGGGAGTFAQTGIINNGGIALEAVTADGFLKIARCPLADGTSYAENTTRAPIAKNLTALPTTGVVKIEFGMKNINGMFGQINLSSGSTNVVTGTFLKNEGNNTVSTNNFTAVNVLSTTSLGMQQQEWLCDNVVVLDYTNNRVYTRASRGGYENKNFNYYAEDGTKFADAAAAAEAGVNVPGLPITVKVEEVMQDPLAIDKITLLPYEPSNGNILFSNHWISYDYVRITHTAENGTQTVLLNDTFDDSTKNLMDYGWWLDGTTAYYKTEVGFGVVEAKSTSNKQPLPKVALGKTYNEGKVAVEFTVESKTYNADGTVTGRNAYNSFTGSTKGLVNIMGGDTVTCPVGYRSNSATFLYIGTSFDASAYSNGISYGFAYGDPTPTEMTFKLLLDLDNGVVTPYKYVNGEWTYSKLGSNPSFVLTPNGDGLYVVDSIGISEYLYMTAGNGVSGALGIKNVNVYEVDDNGVALPGFFNADYDEITTAAAGDSVTAYVPVNNQDEKEITVIVASFAADGTFKSVTPVDISANAGIGLVKVPVTVAADAAAGDYIRLMVWDNMDNVKPYVVPVDLTVAAE